MQVDFLVEGDSISFYSPNLPNGGLRIDNCVDIEEAKRRIVSFFKERHSFDVILKKVLNPTTMFIRGIHTP